MKNTVLVIDSAERRLIDLTGALRRELYLVHYMMLENIEDADFQQLQFDMAVIYVDVNNEDCIARFEQLHNSGLSCIRLLLFSEKKRNFCERIILHDTAKVMLYNEWDQDIMLDAVKRVINYKRTLGITNLNKMIANVKQIPTLPEIFFEVSHLINKKADMEVIAKAVETDIAIASRVLRIANSAYYGARTASILQAMMFLGTESIKNIIISTVVFERESHLYSIKKMWDHAELTNKLANQIYYHLYGKMMPASFSSIGLLHNVGLTLLLAVFDSDYQAVFERRINSRQSLYDIEKDLLGFCHADLGAYILDWWNLPPVLVNGAMYYYKPFEVDARYLETTCIVHLASYLSWQILGENRFAFALDEKVLDYLCIGQSEIDDIVFCNDNSNKK